MIVKIMLLIGGVAKGFFHRILLLKSVQKENGGKYSRGLQLT